MRHQKRSHRYAARREARSHVEQQPAPQAPAPSPPTPTRGSYDDFKPNLGLGYGLSAHMRDFNLERKWQVIGKDVVPRNHGPSEAELLRAAVKAAEARSLVADALAKRRNRQ